MSLKITGHYPSINSTGVMRNETIRIYFNTPIEPSTITWDTISVQEKSSFTTLVGTLGAVWTSSGTVLEADFIPTLTMLPNNEYSVYVFGAPNSIIAKDGTLLNDTYSFDFVTGTGYYDSSGNIGVPSGITSGVYTDITLSGINIIDQANINSFSIYSTIPQNQQPNVNLILNEIQMVFTGNITSTSQEIVDKITITEEEVL